MNNVIVRSRSRMSRQQQQIFNAAEFSDFCLNANQATTADLYSNFSDKLTTILDIGFGNGAQLLASSEAMPEINFIGIELYKKGIANVVNKIHVKNLKNIKIIYGDAKEALKKLIKDGSLHKIQIFFPDPWPKRRHYKRRLIQNDFIEIVKGKLMINGILHIATDVDDYATNIIKIMDGFPEFCQLQNVESYMFRSITKFEKIGLSLGHKIWDLVFVLNLY